MCKDQEINKIGKLFTSKQKPRCKMFVFKKKKRQQQKPNQNSKRFPHQINDEKIFSPKTENSYPNHKTKSKSKSFHQ